MSDTTNTRETREPIRLVPCPEIPETAYETVSFDAPDHRGAAMVIVGGLMVTVGCALAAILGLSAPSAVLAGFGLMTLLSGMGWKARS